MQNLNDLLDNFEKDQRTSREELERKERERVDQEKSDSESARAKIDLIRPIAQDFVDTLKEKGHSANLEQVQEGKTWVLRILFRPISDGKPVLNMESNLDLIAVGGNFLRLSSEYKYDYGSGSLNRYEIEQSSKISAETLEPVFLAFVKDTLNCISPKK